MAIPAIGGACFLEILDLLQEATLTTPLSTLAIGATISFVVGLFSLSWLMRLLQKGELQWFAYWCILVGVGVVVWQLSIR